jgi:ABC-type transport system substrate-binding protein
VREAFAYAFDRETYCEAVRDGDCLPALSWVPPGVGGHIETAAYDFDPEQARQALAASSYGGPERLPEITLTYISDDPTERERMEWLAGHYRDVLGIELVLAPVDSATLAAMTREAATFPQMTMLGWGQDYPDPRSWFGSSWTCNSTILASLIGYCNATIDQLISQADTELDPHARVARYEEAGRLLVADAPAVFAFNQLAMILVKPNVAGYIATPIDYLYPGQSVSLLTIAVH